MPSPLCTVANGGSAPQATPPFATVTPGATVTIALASNAGVNAWSIVCIGTDETTLVTDIALTVNAAARTATFVAPAAGKAMIFRSAINGGADTNGTAQPSYAATFKVVTLTPTGQAVAALNEAYEHHATYGWTGLFNAAVRSSGGAPAGAAGGSLGATYPSPTVVRVDGASGVLPIGAAKTSWDPGGAAAYDVGSELVTAQTTDATVTTAYTFAMSDARIADIQAIVVGYRPSSGDSYRVDLSATYKRFAGGVPTLVGTLSSSNERKDTAAAAWLATLDISANSVRVRVTGAAAATINWCAQVSVQERT